MNKTKLALALVAIFTTVFTVSAVPVDECLTARECHTRGLFVDSAGDWANAINNYDRAIDLDRSFVEAWVSRGLIKQRRKYYRDALADYTEAILIDPTYGKAYLSRGSIRRMPDYPGDQSSVKDLVQDVDGAIADFDKALELDPKLAVHVTYYRGITKTRSGDLAGGLKDINKAQAIAKDLSNPNAQNFIQTVSKAKERTQAKIKAQVVSPAPLVKTRGGVNYSPAQREAWLRGSPLPQPVAL